MGVSEQDVKKMLEATIGISEEVLLKNNLLDFRGIFGNQPPARPFVEKTLKEVKEIIKQTIDEKSSSVPKEQVSEAVIKALKVNSTIDEAINNLNEKGGPVGIENVKVENIKKPLDSWVAQNVQEKAKSEPAKPEPEKPTAAPATSPTAISAAQRAVVQAESKKTADSKPADPKPADKKPETSPNTNTPSASQQSEDNAKLATNKDDAAKSKNNLMDMFTKPIEMFKKIMEMFMNLVQGMLGGNKKEEQPATAPATPAFPAQTPRTATAPQNLDVILQPSPPQATPNTPAPKVASRAP